MDYKLARTKKKTNIQKDKKSRIKHSAFPY